MSRNHSITHHLHWILVLPFFFTIPSYASQNEPSVESVLQRVRAHNFEYNSGYDGVGDMNDMGWRVRTLAVRDLVRAGKAAVPAIQAGLQDSNADVRQVCVKALGLLKAAAASQDLQKILQSDANQVVRCDAAQALGLLGDKELIPFLRQVAEKEKNKNVKHRSKLAVRRLEKGEDFSGDGVKAYTAMDESSFRTVKVGQPALDFSLKDTNGKTWTLSDHQGKTVVLIWIFADWCPVCHNEFYDLIEMEKEYRDNNVQVLTLECHDTHRCRSMVADRDLWWPHLIDNAGAVGAKYGVDPMEFVVHDEWINRPSTIIVDPLGIVRFAYYGTYWGDRPTIKQTLDMIKSGKYQFEHPKRRKPRS